MKKFICFVFALLPVMCAAQATSGFHRVNQVITRGNSGVTALVVPSARVFVQNTNSGLAATIYSDPLLTLTIPGAIVTTDVNGNYGYYAPLNTCFTENISSPSQGSLIIPNVCGNSGLSLPLGTLNGGTGTTTAPLPGQILVGQISSVYLPETLIGDCTISSSGSITCLKTNGVPFTSAATTPIGTSGAVIPLLSSANTWSQNQTFSGSSTSGTIVGISNSSAKNWQLISEGSSSSDSGHFDIFNATDSVLALSLSNNAITTTLPISISGSPVCTTANGACASGSGSVTSFSAPSGTWPSWLVPTVTNSTTTPSLAVAASAIPNSALANTVITVNSVPCTLGSSCSVSGTSRSCNANGCYIIAADGTIQEWGSATGCAATSACNVAVVFPFPFTTTANQSVVVSEQGGGANNYLATVGGLTTTGFNVQYAALVFNSGGGTSLPGSQTADWVAIGR